MWAQPQWPTAGGNSAPSGSVVNKPAVRSAQLSLMNDMAELEMQELSFLDVNFNKEVQIWLLGLRIKRMLNIRILFNADNTKIYSYIALKKSNQLTAS